MYDEKAKERNARYKKKSREQLTLDFPKGTKEVYKKYAEEIHSMSLTKLFMWLMEEDMHENGYFPKKDKSEN